MKVFVIGGGMMVRETTPLLVKYLQEENANVYATEDAEALCGSYFAECDLFVLNSCLWTGSGHTISQAAKEAFLRHLDAGKGVVAMHSSIANWDDWPEFGDLVGAVWSWSKENGSKHSSPDSVFTIELLDSHPLLEGVPSTFEVTDEMYYDLAMAQGNHVIARTTGAFGGHPMVWHRRSGNSKVAAIMIGHDVRACSHPQYVQLFKNACAYTTKGDRKR